VCGPRVRSAAANKEVGGRRFRHRQADDTEGGREAESSWAGRTASATHASARSAAGRARCSRSCPVARASRWLLLTAARRQPATPTTGARCADGRERSAVHCTTHTGDQQYTCVPALAMACELVATVEARLQSAATRLHQPSSLSSRCDQLNSRRHRRQQSAGRGEEEEAIGVLCDVIVRAA
jgi:hypothetical protein